MALLLLPMLGVYAVYCIHFTGDSVGALSFLHTNLPNSVDYFACEILDRGGRLIGAIPSSNACILPGLKVGVSALFSMISFSFEAVRGEYLSCTQWLRKGWPFCPFCTCINIIGPHGLNRRTIEIN